MAKVARTKYSKEICALQSIKKPYVKQPVVLAVAFPTHLLPLVAQSVAAQIPEPSGSAVPQPVASFAHIASANDWFVPPCSTGVVVNSIVRTIPATITAPPIISKYSNAPCPFVFMQLTSLYFLLILFSYLKFSN
jgi:hypothetical protein